MSKDSKSVENKSKSPKHEGDHEKNALFAIYQDLLNKYPLLINTTQGVLTQGLSVITSQYLDHINKEKSDLSFLESINWTEVITMSTISAVYITPILMIFYSYLNKSKANNVTKLIIDQIIFSPIFTFGIILLRVLILNPSLTFYNMFHHTATVAPKAVRTSWLFWIPLRYFTIKYIPPAYQLLFGNVCAYIWNIILQTILN